MKKLNCIRKCLYPMIAVAALSVTSCGPTLDEGADARIQVTPPRQIAFTRVTVGEQRTMPFVITSVGKDPLDVRKIEWSGSDAVTLVADGSGFPRELTTLASMPVAVEFNPTSEHPSPSGEIKIYSNDTSKPIYTLNVIAQQLAPQIHVSPSAEEKLIFGQTEIGETATRNVIITNEGDLPLVVSKIALTSSDAFHYEIVGDKSLPVQLAPNHATSLSLKVDFEPKSTGRDEATLAITSNDPALPVYSLPVIANSNTPCIQIEPTLLEFLPAVSVGGSQTKTVLLKSCSDVPLTIMDVVPESSSELFTHELINAGKPLEKDESARLEITFSPISEGTSQVSYKILNDDPLNRNAVLKVIATSSKNQRPVAKARARLSSSNEWRTDHLDLSPLDVIILDGSLSTDKESKSLKYIWSVTSPEGSTSKIVTNTEDDGKTASFFLDLIGNYEFCLNVEDTDHMVSANSDCITVTVAPSQTIHVQLTWITPMDNTIGNGDGADLDLHFVTLPDGHWGERGRPELNDGSDIYFGNRSASWVVPGYGIEEPMLDRDDQDGEGPENIHLDKPAPCRWYAVGVHYYQDNGLGASYATVNIYINGKQRFTRPNVSLSQTDVFKQFAWLFYDGSDVYIFEEDKDQGIYLPTYDDIDEWVGVSPVIPDGVMNMAKSYAPRCFNHD